ncbi:hypothetical protein EV356DRAFT_25016 [Viridothelium virens]|uniref:Uncharacterized protein n=1 Tax=Viridothelium virens TaxID=1048519 RepID=A0A6A6GTK0_VIRVR|nr:hypothetical protein EV356DRAFT_25016 [Viridothelium virens]
MPCHGFDIFANCTNVTTPIQFDADPDIAGIGVILAFLLSAWLTFFFVVITFLFAKDFNCAPNELDRRVVQRTRKISERIRTFLPQFLKPDRQFSLDAIEDIAFTLGDQQLITGTSILIVGFARHCVITEYHFFVVSLLGLASFATHQSTILIVRAKLRRYPWKKWWRLMAIFLIFIFNLLGNILTFNDYFLVELGLVTQCAWSSLPYYYSPLEIFLLAFTAIFLLWGFLAITWDICPELHPFFRSFSIKRWHYALRERVEGPEKMPSRLMNSVSSLLFLLYITVVQILTSDIIDLYRV